MKCDCGYTDKDMDLVYRCSKCGDTKYANDIDDLIDYITVHSLWKDFDEWMALGGCNAE